MYTAWCLTADVDFIDRISKPGYLREAFDPRPAQELAKELGDKRPFYDALMGEFEVLSDEEAALDRQRAEAALRARRDRLSSWLRDRKLQPVVERIRRLSLKPSARPVSLFALFDESEETVAQHLRARGLSTPYATYLSGSLVIHGSSLERSIFITGTVIWPRFTGLKDDLEIAGNEILTWCNQAALLLFFVRNYLPQ